MKDKGTEQERVLVSSELSGWIYEQTFFGMEKIDFLSISWQFWSLL